MASDLLAVGDDAPVHKIAYRGSDCATPARRDAEERGLVIWVE
jgi:hypothetical protein